MKQNTPIDVTVGSSPDAHRARIRELEARLEESEDTLAAIRRGDFDAVVVETPDGEQQVYTLENADRPYRVLIEQIQEGAFTLSADGIILYCNRCLAKMLDTPQERLIGTMPHRFIHGSDRAAFDRMFKDAFNGAARGELNLVIQGRGTLPVYLSLSQLQRDETTALICGVLTDLTDQKLHLRQLSEANDRLQVEGLERERIEEALRQAQKMEAVGQLTGGVAHDFNNLLTIIKSSTELLRRPDLAEDRRRRYVDAISDTVDRASKLTSQLLAFARRQSLKPEVFDVGMRLQLTADMLTSIVGARIQIRRELPISPCYVRADVSQFETALVNLAVNARDAMDGEGTLVLRVFVALTHSPSSGRGHEPKLVAISMSDTGCGIPQEKIDRIFEPFFTTKEVGKGTGLGLSQVFGFAKQSGGKVEVDSDLGKGTTFTLFLPHVEATASDLTASTPQGEAETGFGRHVLVVEDNTDVGAFSTQLLQDLGYKTTWAANADEALKLLGDDATAFDVVFSDVVMPGMNGVDLGRAIRDLRPGLPVVLTSGYSDVLAEDGLDGFELLNKPYSLAELSRVLKMTASRASTKS